jgi:NAD(P)-dependent dehydrogenase (short-subunit alcohol dehydrogenase family)
MSDIIQTAGPQLKGKSALITGASRGIGAAIAEAFVAHGARVVLAARTVSDMDVLADRIRRSGGDVRVIGTDITDAAQVDAAVQLAVSEFGRLDIAVNNAGVSQKRIDFHELAPDAFDHTLSVNVRCLFRAMQSQIRAMLAGGSGSIVNIASVTSVIGVANMAAYCASRHAVVGLTKSAALDYATRNIRINAVAPGPVMTAQLKAGGAATPQGTEAMRSAIPMGRIGEPDEISGAVVFMASDAASFVTGAYLPVDGGYITP